ncbi:MAG: ABC transporter permease [Betaproteobacteria bacterium]|nr:ABC transporter permease [Betaproteobacteria bacterium]
MFASWLDHPVVYSFTRSRLAQSAGLIALVMVLGAVFAPWLAPSNPFDLASLDLNDALLPPAWQEQGSWKYWLGTDDQGRDVFSTILYGSRISLLVGVSSVLLAMFLGVSLGLISGFVGGRIDAVIMRVADVQLSFPAILIALLIDGVARAVFAQQNHGDSMAILVLIGSISLANWVSYARTVRGSTLVEKNKEYVQAARVIGVPALSIMLRHVLPNVTGPVLVIATINIATAIITEATLSFLGVGVPPTTPSLGTMINNGNNFLYSGEWWLVVFPGLGLVLLCMTVNKGFKEVKGS